MVIRKPYRLPLWSNFRTSINSSPPPSPNEHIHAPITPSKKPFRANLRPLQLTTISRERAGEPHASQKASIAMLNLPRFGHSEDLKFAQNGDSHSGLSVISALKSFYTAKVKSRCSPDVTRK